MTARLWTVGALSALAVLVAPGVAHAALAISVPTSASLGSGSTGAGTRTAQLGTITVTASGVVAPSFTATVSSTNFTTGGATTNETITRSNVSYWSGSATVATGTLSTTPGQSNAGAAVTLASTRTAFSAVGLALNITVAWNPTLIVTIPASAVAGTYTGTITHSVA